MITSLDVARAAGVSQATVSRALRDERGVSPQTRARVRAAARKLGYVAGRPRSTGAVAVVSAPLDNPFYPALVGPLQEALDRLGLRTVLLVDLPDRPPDLSTLVDGAFAGVVLTTCERGSTLPAELAARGVPVALADRAVDECAVDTCVADNRFGAATVAELLVELGHRRIAAIMGPESASTGHERWIGFVDRLAALGVPPQDVALVRGPFTAETGRRGLEALLGDGSALPTAVFCGNDVIAGGVLDAATALGLRVPEDLTVVGFGGTSRTGWGRDDLTTVHVDLAAMATTVAEALAARLRSPDAPARRVVLVPRLLARGTHAPPPDRRRSSPGRGVVPEAQTLRSWMSAVSAVARAVNAAHSPAAVLTMVAKRACALIGFDYCAVMLADEEKQALRVVGFAGLTSEYVDLVNDEGALQIHPDGPERDTPAARAFREQRTIAVPDTRAATVFGRLRDLAPKQGYRSLLATPLKQGDTVRGLLVGYRQEPHTFSALEIELAELLAEQTSAALQTADLRRAQQEVIRELSAVNAEMTRARQQLEWAENQHRRLMQLVLDDAGLDGICRALAEILRSSITVEGEGGRRLAHAAHGAYVPPPPAPWQVTEGGAGLQIVRVEGPDEAWTAPVVLGGQQVGRLWVTGLAEPLSPIERRAIERFVLVVGVELLQRKHLVEVQERLSGDLLADLLRPAGVAQPAALLDRAAAFGLDLREPHTLCLVVPADGRGPGALTARCRDVLPAPALVGVHDGAVVVLLPAAADPVAALGRLHARRGPDEPVTVVGRTVDTLDGYLPAYRIAAGVARLRAGSGPGLVDARALGTAALLLAQGGPPEDLRRFARQVLGPLADPRTERDRDLVTTLRAWLASGCSVARTAEALVMHVNTVAYRLKRVAEILRRDLGEVQTRFDVHLALLVLEVGESSGTPGTEHTLLCSGWNEYNM